ncbi:MAG: hypothetical protein II727_00485, partial [Oscillospiraceae bacterium]|nr:hypothetical protein [Oscillospiraceae bacterium]
MMQILFTSSVLILALFVLRAVFLRAIPRRVQYALWALVLLRLLVPFSLPGSAHSLAQHAQGALQTAEAAAAQPIYTEEIGT